MGKLDENSLYLEYKSLLFSIAYRMLGRVSEAEDVVQETFLSYFERRRSDITNHKAYLCKITTNLCLDILKSARKKREVYVGPWLPEPYIITEDTPMNQMISNDTLTISYLFMMETLTPTERAVFLLKEVFRFSYSEIALIVNKNEANCRKIFTRAKSKINPNLYESKLNNEKNQKIILDFLQAFQSGDMNKVISLVSEDVTLYSDGGGIVKAAINPIHTRDRVLAFILGILKKAPDGLKTEVKNVNGHPGVLNTIQSGTHSVVSFYVQDSQIKNIYIIMNPEKLKHLQHS